MNCRKYFALQYKVIMLKIESNKLKKIKELTTLHYVIV